MNTPTPFSQTKSSFEWSLWKAYRLRWKRRRFLFRVLRKCGEITNVVNRTSQIGANDILAFSTVRNEMERLPHSLDYHRALGVGHFFFVDNDSTDGTSEFLEDQPDVSLWHTKHSYRLSRFGVDWLGALQFRYGHGHWCLTLDADELLVFPDCERQSLDCLTRELTARGQTALGAIMLDLFPMGPVGDADFDAGANPINTIPWFDADGYRCRIHHMYGNEWIQGGVRDRVFFSEEPQKAPTLNKFPLVLWNRRYAYVNSTHQLLPTSLHKTYDPLDRRNISGALLHTKFLPSIVEKSREEMQRRQHFQNSDLYQTYYEALVQNPDLWTPKAIKYLNSRQLVDLGLISQGD